MSFSSKSFTAPPFNLITVAIAFVSTSIFTFFHFPAYRSKHSKFLTTHAHYESKRLARAILHYRAIFLPRYCREYWRGLRSSIILLYWPVKGSDCHVCFHCNFLGSSYRDRNAAFTIAHERVCITLLPFRLQLGGHGHHYFRTHTHTTHLYPLLDGWSLHHIRLLQPRIPRGRW